MSDSSASQRPDADAEYVEVQCQSWDQFEHVFRKKLEAERVFVPSMNPPPAGTQLEFRFSIPDGGHISLPAHVVTSAPPSGPPSDAPERSGMLLELGSLSRAEERRVHALLRSLEQKRVSSMQPPPGKSLAPLAEITMAPPVRVTITPKRRESLPADPGGALDRLHAELFSLKQCKDDYALLGLPPGADASAVHAAYLALSKRYHPHRFARYGVPEMRRVATEVYVVVQRAYARLSESARLPVPESERRKTRRTNRDLVDIQVSQAVELLELRQYANAIELLTAVVQDHPDKASARLWLLVAGARFARSRGESDKAREFYGSVLELAPDHAEARSELGSLAPRAEPARVSLVDRLLGRKG